MLRPIKTFYVIDKSVPQLTDWEEAIRIANEETCVVEVRWCPSIMAGWYHDYVFGYEDPKELDAKTPKIYGV